MAYISIGQYRNDQQRIAGQIRKWVIHGQELFQDNKADYKELATAQGTTDEFTAILFNYATTTRNTLSVNATTGVISCITGLRLFKDFNVNQYVSCRGFTNGGNNFDYRQVTAAGDDSVTVDNTGLVTEASASNSVCFVTPTGEEIDETQHRLDLDVILDEIYDFLFTTNSFTAPSELRILKFRRALRIEV